MYWPLLYSISDIFGYTVKPLYRHHWGKGKVSAITRYPFYRCLRKSVATRGCPLRTVCNREVSLWDFWPKSIYSWPKSIYAEKSVSYMEVSNIERFYCSQFHADVSFSYKCKYNDVRYIYYKWKNIYIYLIIGTEANLAISSNVLCSYTRANIASTIFDITLQYIKRTYQKIRKISYIQTLIRNTILKLY